MSIADFKSNKQSAFRRTEFIKFTPGQHIIRFLQTKATVYGTHYTHNITFRCLGEECPICQNNRSMIAEMGYDKARESKGYIPVRQVAYINVLDRTVCKVCPECGMESKKAGATFPATCSKCNASLVSVPAMPLDKIRMLNKGKQFFDQLELLKTTILDETQTPRDFTTYDFSVLVLGGKNAPALSALPQNSDEIEVNKEDLFDPEKAIYTFTVDEIQQILRGVSASDIWRARKSVAHTDDVPDEEVAGLKDSLSGIFEN